MGFQVSFFGGGRHRRDRATPPQRERDLFANTRYESAVRMEDEHGVALVLKNTDRTFFRVQCERRNFADAHVC